MSSQEIAFHPLANIFPLLEGQQFRELVEDIRIHGLREPIILYDGAILDGRNRFNACYAAQVATRFKTYDGKDALAFVISKNLRRRHLDASQRALIAAQISDFGINNDGRGRPRKAGARDKAGRLLLPLKNPDRPAKQAKYPAENRLSEVGVGQGKGKRRAHIGDGFGMDIETAATLMNVSIPTIRDAKHVLRNGSPGLIAAVQSGTASVSAGKEFSVLPKEQQDKILKSGGAASVSVMGKRVKERRLNKRRIERAAGAETKSAIFDHIKIGDGRSIGNLSLIHIFTFAATLCLAHACAAITRGSRAMAAR